MCRNITPLRGLAPPATRDEIEAAALQYVRKVGSLSSVSDANRDAVERAVLRIADVTEELLARAARTSPAAQGRPSVAAHRRTHCRRRTRLTRHRRPEGRR